MYVYAGRDRAGNGSVSFVERPGDSNPSPPALSMQGGVFFFVVDGRGFRDFFPGIYKWDTEGVPYLA